MLGIARAGALDEDDLRSGLAVRRAAQAVRRGQHRLELQAVDHVGACPPPYSARRCLGKQVVAGGDDDRAGQISASAALPARLASHWRSLTVKLPT